MIAAMVEAEAAAAVSDFGLGAGGAFSAGVAWVGSLMCEAASGRTAAFAGASKAASGRTASPATEAAAVVAEGRAFGTGGYFRANNSSVGVVVEAKVSCVSFSSS